MSTIKQVRAFVAVAQTRSFAEACSLVHLSQPALSIAIKNLENSLGGPLLARTTRTLSLTPEGEEFLPVARRLLRDWDAAIEDAHTRFALRRGKLAIATMPSFACNLLPAALAGFRRQYPAINISVEDVVAEQVIELVRSGRVEVGIAFDPEKREDLRFTPLFQDELIAVVPRGDTLAKKAMVDWAELLTHDFIALQRPSSLRILMDEKLAEHTLRAKVAFETHQLATIGRMVAEGLGVSAVPSLCADQMREMGAHCCALKAPVVSRQVGIVTRRRYPLSRAAQAFKHVLEDNWP